MPIEIEVPEFADYYDFMDEFGVDAKTLRSYRTLKQDRKLAVRNYLIFKLREKCVELNHPDKDHCRKCSGSAIAARFPSLNSRNSVNDILDPNSRFYKFYQESLATGFKSGLYDRKYFKFILTRDYYTDHRAIEESPDLVEILQEIVPSYIPLMDSDFVKRLRAIINNDQNQDVEIEDDNDNFSPEVTGLLRDYKAGLLVSEIAARNTLVYGYRASDLDIDLDLDYDPP